MGQVGEIQRAYTKGQKRRRPGRVIHATLPLQEVVRHQVTVSRSVIEPENLRWFVARVAPQKEERVVGVFDLTSIPAAIPTTPREKRRRGKLHKWREPNMPGYVLIGFPGVGAIPWYDVLKFQIVRSIVGLNGNPMQVPWRTTYCDKGDVKRGGVEILLPDLEAVRIGAAKFMRTWSGYQADQKVRIEAGSFAGFEGRVQEATESEVHVLLEIFGRQTPVKLPAGDVVKAA